MYLDLVNYNDLRSRTAYPTIVHGLYSLTADLFDKILEFIVLGDIKELRNKVWIEKTGTYLKF
ncbi:hypothetical protein PET01_09370 [Pediococcus ethanolidurans]|nr:hypothetical protein PET01_09370 [Pediococcus ethanolidurans]